MAIITNRRTTSPRFGIRTQESTFWRLHRILFPIFFGTVALFILATFVMMGLVAAGVIDAGSLPFGGYHYERSYDVGGYHYHEEYGYGN